MTKTAKTVAQVVAELFAKSEKTLSEKLSSEEYNTFTTEANEAHSRIEAQQDGNLKLKADYDAEKSRADQAAADLANAQGELATAQEALKAANARLAELEPKATQWDGYQASLKGAHPKEDSTNDKKKADAGLSEADQQEADRIKALKEKHPSLMAEFDI